MKKTISLASTLRMLGTASALSASLLAALPTFASGGASNFFGNYSLVSSTDMPQDPTKPAPVRSYFVLSTEETRNGARLYVDIYNGKKNDPVSLWLQVAVNDGKGNVTFIPVRQLSDKVKDNPQNYHSQRVFDIDYAQLNQELKALLPSEAQHIEVGPGSALFVAGYWDDYSHSWGGAGRGGIFFLPDSSGSQQQQVQSGNLRRATELDLAYSITNLMAARYNKIVTRGGSNISVGVKEGGQIKSRLESEGKFQIPLAEADDVKKALYELANNPQKAEKVLGNEWTIQPELRYMKKDAQGQLILDENGLPTPDPMVDTMYDNASSDAAKNDVVIRYRMTEGNGYGSWNFKNGEMRYTKHGIANRLESSVDATDAKPETIRKYADSTDPLNIFAPLFNLNPKSKPSDYLQTHAIKLSDVRHKFKLKHKNGLVIEVSFDDVSVESNRGKPEVLRFVQMEADVDHPATSSANVATVQTGGAASFAAPTLDKVAVGRLGKAAFVDGRPIMHTVEDLDPKSPINVKLADDFKLAEKAIVALRKAVIGKNWLPGAQKYALSAYLAGHVTGKKVSPSVERLLTRVKEITPAGKRPPRLFRVDKEQTCRNLFD